MAEPAKLTCQELVELVTEYLEGTLPPAERVRFEAHLLDCDDCPVYLDQMRLTIRVAGALSEDRLPRRARDEMLRLFRDWNRC
ncbi:MAG: zf-HC2 domain-containing protein [Chloroflexia bacterium]|nr:zf-HC2 domain-containing protein [Chloroflexia bacterium]